MKLSPAIYDCELNGAKAWWEDEFWNEGGLLYHNQSGLPPSFDWKWGQSQGFGKISGEHSNCFSDSMDGLCLREQLWAIREDLAERPEPWKPEYHSCPTCGRTEWGQMILNSECDVQPEKPK